MWVVVQSALFWLFYYFCSSYILSLLWVIYYFKSFPIIFGLSIYKFTQILILAGHEDNPKQLVMLTILWKAASHSESQRVSVRPTGRVLCGAGGVRARLY